MKQRSLSGYVTGFILSLILTLSAYLLVSQQIDSQYHDFSRDSLIVVIIGLAILQLCVQLFFFLHLGREAKPRWKIMVFWFMLLVLTILVGGSLWIMQNLDYSMSSNEMNHYMTEQNKRGF